MKKENKNIKYFIYPEYSIYSRQNEVIDPQSMDRKYCVLTYNEVEFIEEKTNGFYDDRIYVIKLKGEYIEVKAQYVFDNKETANDYVIKHNKDLLRNISDRLIVLERKTEKMFNAFR